MIYNKNRREVILAYSGGLDTTYCLVKLSRKGYKVHAVSINTGAFTDEDIDQLNSKALLCGAKSFTCIDVREKYYEKTLKYLLFGNVLKNQVYPLSVSSERLVQAMAIAEYANEMGIDAIAHGSTGAGNDQVRFDLVFKMMIKNVNIITPIRDFKLSREEEIAFLESHGIALDFKKAQYSINKGLWGTSIGGVETLKSLGTIPETAWPTQVTAKVSQNLVIQFEKGEPVALNDCHYNSKSELIDAITMLAGPYGIGRDVHVGDTVIGIKGRVAFEAPAAMILIKAHHLLEKHVLSKQQLYWKDQLSNWYGNQLHDGMVFDPVMRDIERFLESSQQNVNGKVHIELHPYRFVLQGVESAHDLMQSKFGVYGESNGQWTSDEAKGFIHLMSVPFEIHKYVNEEN